MIIGSAWFIFALGAAIAWGIGYAFGERVMGAGVSPSVLMLIYVCVAVPSYIALTYVDKTLKPSFEVLQNNGTIAFYLAIVVVAFVVGNIFIFKGVSLKSAAHASIVEMSYPIFVVFFGWLFFREINLNLATILGGAMILSGVTLIHLKS